MLGFSEESFRPLTVPLASSDRGKLTIMSAGGVVTGNGTDESMDEGTLDCSSTGREGMIIGWGIGCGGEAARRGDG